MYWENGIRYSAVADTMSRDRFISLRSFFHICDDTLMIPKGEVFTRAGISGIVYDIEIYTGKGAVEISELGQGTDVVLRLVENLPRFMNFKLFFDNFYTGIDLIHKLRVEYGIECMWYDTQQQNEGRCSRYRRQHEEERTRVSGLPF
ncbi:hypothetical protein QYM36_019850 [Artemia franciscana]|uniref:PiggyBac transposable element-derived protein domain-containing protein n=1 Tax=Artemia franciscana TaxID=6661 RepID=A0AA88KTI1_ARTSF|nr:hypothetical protein QYM36_019850 [Artemia franciscana]